MDLAKCRCCSFAFHDKFADGCRLLSHTLACSLTDNRECPDFAARCRDMRRCPLLTPSPFEGDNQTFNELGEWIELD
ncbi:hypothetical protein ES708_17287 [subsurface metagenome]